MGYKQTYATVKAQRDKFLSTTDQGSFDFQIATWFRTGLIIPAPGTWGTLGGMVLGVPLLFLTNSALVFLVGIILFFVGLQCVERLEEKSGDHDSSFIVIDEVAAILMLLALLPSTSIVTLTLGFLLFRYFDAKKPWLVGMADKKIKGALGVMADDVVAAIFALISYYILVTIFLLTMGAAGLALFGYGTTH